MHINNHQIYLPQESGGYRVHNATKTRQHTAILAEATPETTTSLPEECILADLTITNTYTKLQYSVPSTRYSKTKPISINQQWQELILRHIHITDKNAVQLAFSSHLPTTAVSDGGVHNYESNFGLVIADQHKVITTNMGKLYSIDF
jgi:hypothetical protein